MMDLMNFVGPPPARLSSNCSTLTVYFVNLLSVDFPGRETMNEHDAKTKYTLCRTASVTGQEIYIIPLSTSTAYLR